ncbi:MAG: hypothetical protein KDA81_03350 [Planctomycetaceae bacterium]|nr:hypothetical protein [Planctomycetaceae bacterium]
MGGQSESVVNNVLIQMARSFLQYVSESSPWVRLEAVSIGEQLNILAARQRQDVADLAEFLAQREYFIDFGSFPTEYTDLQFLSLNSLFERLHHSQALICDLIDRSVAQLRGAGDEQAAGLMAAVDVRQKEITQGLKELDRELNSVASA